MQDANIQQRDTKVLCTIRGGKAFCGSSNCAGESGDVEAIGSYACQEPRREREG